MSQRDAIRALAGPISDLSRIASDPGDEFAPNANDLGCCLAVAVRALDLADEVRAAVEDANDGVVDWWWAAAVRWHDASAPLPPPPADLAIDWAVADELDLDPLMGPVDLITMGEG